MANQQPSYIDVDAMDVDVEETLLGNGQEQHVEHFWAGTEPLPNDDFDHPFEDAMWEFNRLKEIDELDIPDMREPWDREISESARDVLADLEKYTEIREARMFLELNDQEFLKEIYMKGSAPQTLAQDTSHASSRRLPSSSSREGKSSSQRMDVRVLRRAEADRLMTQRIETATASSSRMPNTSSVPPSASERMVVRDLRRVRHAEADRPMAQKKNTTTASSSGMPSASSVPPSDGGSASQRMVVRDLRRAEADRPMAQKKNTTTASPSGMPSTSSVPPSDGGSTSTSIARVSRKGRVYRPTPKAKGVDGWTNG